MSIKCATLSSLNRMALILITASSLVGSCNNEGSVESKIGPVVKDNLSTLISWKVIFDQNTTQDQRWQTLSELGKTVVDSFINLKAPHNSIEYHIRISQANSPDSLKYHFVMSSGPSAADSTISPIQPPPHGPKKIQLPHGVAEIDSEPVEAH